MARSWKEVCAELDVADRSRIEPALDLMYGQAVASIELQGRVEELRKADQSPVTVVDLLHQMQCQAMLAQAFPEDGLICEEPRSLQEQVFEEAAVLSREVYGIELGPTLQTLPQHGEVTWVMDPIDGTKGFVGGRCFAIALGYFKSRQPFFGGLAVPGGDPEVPRAIDRRLAFGIAGQGAWWTRVSRGVPAAWEPLTAPSWEGGPIRVAVSLAHAGVLGERLARATDLQVIRLDSQAKYLAVAGGEIDAYLRAGRDDGVADVVWDHMPGGLLAAEAGCRVCHFDGGTMAFEERVAVGFRGGVICSAPSAAGRLLERLQALVGE